MIASAWPVGEAGSAAARDRKHRVSKEMITADHASPLDWPRHFALKLVKLQFAHRSGARSLRMRCSVRLFESIGTPIFSSHTNQICLLAQ
jgi:hypothetical protein